LTVFRTDSYRIDDNDKLREKVDEALTVFHEYQKTQGTDGAADGGSSEQQANGEGEEVKA
jgi:hypothetical protein